MRITKVKGIARRAGIKAGDELISIDGQSVADLIDFQFFEANERLSVRVRSGGESKTFEITKQSYEPLGIDIDGGELLRMRECVNDCVFCFVNQLPEGVRPTLKVRDDDWRLSFIMGNYVTLTNVNETELARMAARKAGPLYISVHATDHALRLRLLGVKKAPDIMRQLTVLCGAGIVLHCQIVLCPGLNDGEALRKTLTDIYTLYPRLASVALVPVGLTEHRQGLPFVRPFDQAAAAAALDIARAWQQSCLAQKGTRFVFAADELYLLAGEPLPEYGEYEDFSQIENGVGLLAKLEYEVDCALAETQARTDKRFTLVTGASAADFMRGVAARIGRATGAAIRVAAVDNRFFGSTVTVAGLVTGGDIARVLQNGADGEVLIPKCMLRERENAFLCGMTVEELAHTLGIRVTAVEVDGEKLVEAVLQ